ncbi:hypothetical protein COOONC_17532, partial [Cooperia oncophora]
MVEAIDDMEAVYLTKRQFMDARSLLQSGNYTDATNTAPEVLHPYEPLASDIWDVHRRPILSRAHAMDGELMRNFGETIELQDSYENHINSVSFPIEAGQNYRDTLAETHASKQRSGSAEDFDQVSGDSQLEEGLSVDPLAVSI